MLDDFANVPRVFVFRVVWRPLLVENQLYVSNPGGPDFEGLADELALSINLYNGTRQQNTNVIFRTDLLLHSTAKRVILPNTLRLEDGD